MNLLFRNAVKKVFLVILVLLSGCTSDISNRPEEKDDPHKEFNKEMLEFNLLLDDNILHPASDIYKESVNDSLRCAVGCFLNNLKEPYYAVTYLLSGNFESSANSMFRFLVNSLFGAGIGDVAEHIGLERADTNYKEALKELGVETGDYLVLPVIGSSSTRDAIGEVASWFYDPVGYFIGLPWMLGKAALGAVHDRSENSETIDYFMNQSMDIYSLMKSVYFQKYGVDSDNEESVENEVEVE